ncbi:unnamed protein product [Prorocentrum cordatum]|uniref:Uncharacterized protein n=1 Tax=Prorocentrum cordatum TaxID=2364126 RepID=A0ABN9PU49_9DINO|nr:unnamed protein product [Polarella glacialis]
MAVQFDGAIAWMGGTPAAPDAALPRGSFYVRRASYEGGKASSLVSTIITKLVGPSLWGKIRAFWHMALNLTDRTGYVSQVEDDDVEELRVALAGVAVGAMPAQKVVPARRGGFLAVLLRAVSTRTSLSVLAALGVQAVINLACQWLMRRRQRSETLWRKHVDLSVVQACLLTTEHLTWGE